MESRHLKKWNQEHLIGTVPAVILPRELHNTITQALQAKLPYGTRHEPAKVWAAYQEVYKEFPDWLAAIKHYFE